MKPTSFRWMHNALSQLYGKVGEVRSFCFASSFREEVDKYIGSLIDRFGLERNNKYWRKAEAEIERVENEIEIEHYAISQQIKLGIIAKFLLFLFPFSRSLKDILEDVMEVEHIDYFCGEWDARLILTRSKRNERQIIRRC